MKVADKLSGISRRDLLKLTGQYGISSTLLAAGAATGALSVSSLAKAADSTYEKRFGKPAKHTLKFGAAGFNARNLLIERAGALEFARDLEERTDGEIRIEFIGDNQICGQLSCVEKTQNDIVQIYSASTQNSAGGAPYLNVLDYAYMFPGRASQYYFLYSPESQKILRDPLEKRHGLKFSVLPLRTARHSARPWMGRQADRHQNRRPVRHEEPRDGHAARPDRDAAAQPQPCTRSHGKRRWTV